MSGPTDPRKPGGEIAVTGAGAHESVVAVDRAVLLEGVTVALVHLGREKEEDEDAIAMELRGPINATGGKEEARILYLFDELGVATIVAELTGLIQRAGPEWQERYRKALGAAMENLPAPPVGDPEG